MIRTKHLTPTSQYKVLALSGALFLMGASSCSVPKRVAPDSAFAAPMEASDVTAVVEGCGHPPIVGYTYCRVTAGEDTRIKNLTFIAPPARCEAEHCAFLRVFNNKGELVFGDAFPKGQTRISVPWSVLLGRDTFETADRGVFPFFIEVRSLDLNGNEQVSFSEGEVRMRVVSLTANGKPYRALHEVRQDPSFVWRWIDKRTGLVYQWTQGLRAFVGPLKE